MGDVLHALPQLFLFPLHYLFEVHAGIIEPLQLQSTHQEIPVRDALAHQRCFPGGYAPAVSCQRLHPEQNPALRKHGKHEKQQGRSHAVKQQICKKLFPDNLICLIGLRRRIRDSQPVCAQQSFPSCQVFRCTLL